MTREESMKEAAATAAEEAECPMDKLRCLLLTRGYNGIMQFGRYAVYHTLANKLRSRQVRQILMRIKGFQHPAIIRMPRGV